MEVVASALAAGANTEPVCVVTALVVGRATVDNCWTGRFATVAGYAVAGTADNTVGVMVEVPSMAGALVGAATLDRIGDVDRSPIVGTLACRSNAILLDWPGVPRW